MELDAETDARVVLGLGGSQVLIACRARQTGDFRALGAMVEVRHEVLERRLACEAHQLVGLDELCCPLFWTRRRKSEN